MTRQELEHAIRAACYVANETEVYVLGSQSILGTHPNAPPALRQSAEADLVPKNRPDQWHEIDVALGELSQFHTTHRFYVHGISLESAKLPSGWKERCVRVCNANTDHHVGWCLDVPDLALSKLAAFREKDRSFVRVLLRERLVDPSDLLARLPSLPVDRELRDRIGDWIEKTDADLPPVDHGRGTLVE